MKRSALRGWLGCACVAAALGAAPAAWAQTVHAKLSGYQEVPAVSSPGSGEFTARINSRAQVIEYELTFSDTEGSPIMAHIHLAQQGLNGGIMIWLCGNPELQVGTTLPPVPAEIPRCPASGGRVSADIGAAEVRGPAPQLISPGEMEEAIAAIRAGAAYVNVHTTAVSSGELRGQIR